MMDGHELRRILSTHTQLTEIYADDRFPRARNGGADLRAFVLATIWVISVERAGAATWQRVCDILHLTDFQFWRTIGEDAPRYEPDDLYTSGRGCAAPMVRKPGPCRKPGSRGFRVTDPADGTWRTVRYCTRHHAEADQVYAAERARVKAGVPEPLPNRGGLLPCYIRWNWPERYAHARPGWDPPTAGIRADDWPTLAKVRDLEPPKLHVVLGGVAVGEQPLPSGDSPAPGLRLIRTTD